MKKNRVLSNREAFDRISNVLVSIYSRDLVFSQNSSPLVISGNPQVFRYFPLILRISASVHGFHKKKLPLISIGEIGKLRENW